MSTDPHDLPGILEASGPQLYALLARLTLRADVAEDLLQDLFLKLHRSDGWRRALNPTAYVFRAAINLAFDWRRARRVTEPLREEPAIPAAPPLQRLIDAEDFERILDALHNLPELSRTALVLRYLHHLEYKEIAPHLGKTEHQARGLCHKAVSELRELLRPISESPEREGRPP